VLSGLAAACLASGLAGCVRAPALPDGAREFTAPAVLRGTSLTLHLSSPRDDGTQPLVLYASGDGGWFGSAVGMFRTIAATGFPAAGFSTRAFLSIEQQGHATLTPAHIGEGYGEIVRTARTALGLPDSTPVVLTGWSRGAALSVLVAARADAVRPLAGVVAIGLPAEDALDIEPGDDDDPVPARSSGATRRSGSMPLALYPLLARFAPARCAVIQATRDAYLPADGARALLGADSGTRRLFAVDASNHRFSGDRGAFAVALRDALRWASGSSSS
jgi:hypothetical protein